ncbi:MAG TPA: pyridoxal-phosphate dependent enzyme [Acidimicrobiales bacterium]|nr:pyridoxal-phosphate dependent enzyme [Acidimicrobiales bacterium]
MSRERLNLLFSPTPTIALGDDATGCILWLKLDYLLPSGSTKDRFVATVLCDAIERGTIVPSSLVVEASCGSTSIAFAMACALVASGSVQ